MTALRCWVKGCRHGRLVSLKRYYVPDFQPRHAKPVVDSALTPTMELAA